MGQAASEIHHPNVMVWETGAGEWIARARCICGWSDEAVADTEPTAKADVLERWGSHQRSSEPSTSDVVIGGIAGLVMLVVIAAIPIMLVVGAVNLFTGGDDEPARQEDPSVVIEDGSGPDCDKVVTYLMEQEYGGTWGSGAWPEGEYPRRVEECEHG